jgi:serine/threonine protein kinase
MQEEERKHGIVLDIYENNREKIFRKFYPEVNPDKPGGDLKIEYPRESIGSPASRFYIVSENLGGQEYKFMLRHYDKVPESYSSSNGSPRHVVATKAHYFLENSEIECVPKTIMPEGSQTLILEYIEGETLEKRLQNISNGRINGFLDPVLDALVEFQYKATLNLKELSDKYRLQIFVDRGKKEQARDYFTKFSHNSNKERINNFVNAYASLVGKAFQGGEVTHGDLGPRNILINSEEKIIFIDPELKIARDINDIGSLIAYCGDKIKKSKWKELGKTYKQKKLDNILSIEGGKPGIGQPKRPISKWIKDRISRGLLNLEPNIHLTEEGEKRTCFDLYASILHHSLRIIAKNKVSNKFENCDAQEENIRKVLDDFIDNPDRFGLNEEDRDNATILRSEYDFGRISNGKNGNCIKEDLRKPSDRKTRSA